MRYVLQLSHKESPVERDFLDDHKPTTNSGVTPFPILPFLQFTVSGRSRLVNGNHSTARGIVTQNRARRHQRVPEAPPDLCLQQYLTAAKYIGGGGGAGHNSGGLLKKAEKKHLFQQKRFTMTRLYQPSNPGLDCKDFIVANVFQK